MIAKIKYWFLVVSVVTALAIPENDNSRISIGRELIRQKRDLIGWNRTQNTVNQYLRHKTAKDDKKAYANHYKQTIMEMDKEKRQKLQKELKKAITMIRKRRKRKNRSH